EPLGRAVALPAKPGKNLLFLKKKKQKDFARKLPNPDSRKFFGSFFQERTRFLPSRAPHLGGTP
ncbi:MAG: hypothetical protein ACRYGC_00630, partial [Janthinobacterium lividum]